MKLFLFQSSQIQFQSFQSYITLDIFCIYSAKLKYLRIIYIEIVPSLTWNSPKDKLSQINIRVFLNGYVNNSYYFIKPIISSKPTIPLISSDVQHTKIYKSLPIFLPSQPIIGSLFGNGMIEITSILPEMAICGEMYFVTALFKNNIYHGYKSKPIMIRCTDEEDIYLHLKINNIFIQGYKYEDIVKEKNRFKDSYKFFENIDSSLKKMMTNDKTKNKLIKRQETNSRYVNNSLDNKKYFYEKSGENSFKKSNNDDGFSSKKKENVSNYHQLSSITLSSKLNQVTFNNLSFQANDNENRDEITLSFISKENNNDALNPFLLNKIFKNNRQSYHHEVPITISNILSSEIFFHTRLSLHARCPPLSFLILAAPITRNLSNDFIIIKDHKLFNTLQGIKLSTITLPLINGCSQYMNSGEKILFTVEGKLKNFSNSKSKTKRQMKYFDNDYISAAKRNITNNLNSPLDKSLNDYVFNSNLNLTSFNLPSFIKSDNKLIFSSIHPLDQSKSYHIIVIVDPLSLVTNTPIISRIFLFKIELILSSVNEFYDTNIVYSSSKYKQSSNSYHQCSVYSDSSSAYIISGSLDDPVFHSYSPNRKFSVLSPSQAVMNINRIYYKQLHASLLSFKTLKKTADYINLSLSNKQTKNSQENLKSTHFLISASSFLGKLSQFLDFITKALLTIQISSNTSNPALTLSNLLLTTEVLSKTISLICKPNFIYFNEFVKLIRNLIRSPFIPPLSTFQHVIEDVTNSEPPNFLDSLKIPYRLRVFLKRLAKNYAKNTGINENHLVKLRELLIMIVENTWWMLELPQEVNKKLMYIIGETVLDDKEESNKDEITNFNIKYNNDHDKFMIKNTEKIYKYDNNYGFKYSKSSNLNKFDILSNKFILGYMNSKNATSRSYELNPLMLDNLKEKLIDVSSDETNAYFNVTTEIILSLRTLAASTKPLPSQESSNTFFIKLLDALLNHNIFILWDELINMWQKTPKNILMESYPGSDGGHLIGHLEWLNNEYEENAENLFYRVIDGKIVEKGEYEPITGKTFWSPIVMCSCKNEENECSIKESTESKKIIDFSEEYAKNYPKF